MIREPDEKRGWVQIRRLRMASNWTYPLFLPWRGVVEREEEQLKNCGNAEACHTYQTPACSPDSRAFHDGYDRRPSKRAQLGLIADPPTSPSVAKTSRACGARSPSYRWYAVKTPDPFVRPPLPELRLCHERRFFLFPRSAAQISKSSSALLDEMDDRRFQ
jgi:hypothetical protein